MISALLAVVLAVVVAWWGWRGRLAQPLARWAMVARALGLVALLLLLLDPGVAIRRGDRRPLVLLDNSVSMHAARGRAAEAARVAAAIGDTSVFGELTRGEPGSQSTLRDVLAGAVATGRPVSVVTDGEISDVDAIPAEMLNQATVRVLARASGPDVAITDVQAPLRITAGDTLTIDVDAWRTHDAPDSAMIEVHDTSSLLLHGVVHFGASDRGHLHLSAPLPHGVQGERWLRIERVGAPDAEPADDLRWWRLTVTPTPGVVVIAAAPDWDSRALYRTLKDVVEVPIRGFAQLKPGEWRRMDDLRSVPAGDVLAAARSADLLAVRGDPKSWRGFGRARLLWPESTESGDWYLTGGGVSPLNGAFVGAEPDSLPAAAGIVPVEGDSGRGWVGATARLSRRGVAVPVVGGVESRSGRTVTIGATGLYRWPLRGGTADQVWRTLIANAAAWLLATPDGDSVRARVVSPVTQRGRPVHFRWSAAGPIVTLPISLTGPGGEVDDTLRFDGTGDAQLALGVGRYRYTLGSGGSGSLAVEPYADELVPAAVTLKEHVGSGAPSAPRRSLRELVWLFGLAIAGFGTEWLLRRRLGLR